jgi:pimeloyl-ACP methyl ester carboxylesterase
MWDRAGYLRALPGRRHLLFDHRGHGQSDRPTSLNAHRLGEYVEDVRSVLDHGGVERAVLVGYSDGAVVAFTFAARHPERVDAVVGIGGVSHPDDTFEGRHALALDVRQRSFKTWLEEMSSGESEAAPDWLMENLIATPTDMFALEVEAWAEEPSEYHCFSKITAPTLIVCGETENTDGAAQLAVEALRSGSAVVLPGMGHLQAFWRTDLTGPVIASFLAEHVPV